MAWSLACHPNSFGRFGVSGALECLPQIGIRYLEFPIKTDGIPSPFRETPLLTDLSSSRDVDRVLKQVHAVGLSVASTNVTSGNPLTPESLRATLKKLSLARDLGAGLVVGGGGAFQSPEEFSQLIRHLQLIGDRAEALGLIYCCETHPGACQNAAAMRQLLENVDHPAIRLNFDTANLLFYNQNLSILQELQQVLPDVRHIHLKDSRGVYQEWYFPALGEGGAVDFRALQEMLLAGGYAGPLSLEIEGLQNEHDWPLSFYQERLEKSFQYLIECGYEL